MSGVITAPAGRLEGAEVAILRGCRLRPVEAVQWWLAAAEMRTGPEYRPVLKGQRVQAVPLSAFSAAQIEKAYAERADIDPVQFAGRSLRSGSLTSAAESGPRYASAVPRWHF